MQTSWDHATVIEYQQILRIQVGREVLEAAVTDHPLCPVHHQHPGILTMRSRAIGDQLWREFVLVVGEK
jgi:hypothetical protein